MKTLEYHLALLYSDRWTQFILGPSYSLLIKSSTENLYHRDYVLFAFFHIICYVTSRTHTFVITVYCCFDVKRLQLVVHFISFAFIHFKWFFNPFFLFLILFRTISDQAFLTVYFIIVKFIIFAALAQSLSCTKCE